MFTKTDRLRPAALQYMEHGYYTNALPNTKEYYDYWDRERHRCVYGYTVGEGQDDEIVITLSLIHI